MDTVKRCSKCGIEYPRTPEYFHRDTSATRTKDGLKPRCKQCRVLDNRQRSRKHYTGNALRCVPVSEISDKADYSPANLLRLFAMIRRLSYGDCLMCGDWTLERQCCQIIRDTADDNAADGTLVTGSYADLLLYSGDTLAGVFDMRAENNSVRISEIHRQIAMYLCERGWTARDTCRIDYGAITPPDTCLARAYRPLKQSTASHYQTA